MSKEKTVRDWEDSKREMASYSREEDIDVNRQLKGRVFGNAMRYALEDALEYANEDEDGFVASIPWLMETRINTPCSDEHVMWYRWYNALSEEIVGLTTQKHPVLITVHGGGLLGSSLRMEEICAENRKNGTLIFPKFSNKQICDLLKGELEDSTKIPVYSFNEFEQGSSNMPLRYAVVLDLDRVRGIMDDSGYRTVYNTMNKMCDDPIFIVRAGGIKRASEYIKKLMERHGNRNFNHRFDYRLLEKPEEPKGAHFMLASGDFGFHGSLGESYFDGYGRFLGIRPKNSKS